MTSGTELRAALAMAASTAGYSLLPLLILLADGARHPLTINALLSASLLATNLPYVLLRHRSTVLGRPYLQSAARLARSPLTAAMILGNFELAAYALSTRYVDIAVAAVLYESWPATLVAAAAWLHRRNGRYRSPGIAGNALMLAGAAGMALVITSQHGTVTGLQPAQAGHLALGAALASAAALLSSTAAASLRAGTRMAEELAAGGVPAPAAEVLGGTTCSLLANAVIVPLNLALGLLAGERMDPWAMAAATAAAVACHGLPTLLWRQANALTRNLTINAMSYATPALTLVLLLALGLTRVARADLLIAGCAVILATNLATNLLAAAARPRPSP